MGHGQGSYDQSNTLRLLLDLVAIVGLFLAGWTLLTGPPIMIHWAAGTREALGKAAILCLMGALLWWALLSVSGASRPSSEWILPLALAASSLLIGVAALRVWPRWHELITQPEFEEQGLWIWDLTRSRSAIAHATTDEGYKSPDFAWLGGIENDRDQLWHGLKWPTTLAELKISIRYKMTVRKDHAEADTCDFKILIREAKTQETLFVIKAYTHRQGTTDGYERIEQDAKTMAEHVPMLREAEDPQLYFLVQNGDNNCITVRIDAVHIEAYW